MSEVISLLRAGSQAFALLMLFLFVILHIMWSGKSLQLLCILPFGMVCLSAINMFVHNLRVWVHVVNGRVFARSNKYTL